MNKYLESYILNLKVIWEYKTEFFARLIKPIIQIIVLLPVWMGIFKITGRTEIGGFSQELFISYIVLATTIRSAVHGWMITDSITKTIKTGELTGIITKPVDYLKLHFSSTFAELSMNALYGLGLFTIFSLIANNMNGFYFPTLTNLGLFTISTLLSLAIAYATYFMIGCTTFWYGESWSFTGIAFSIQSFLSGEIIPLSISTTLLTISDFMPFKSMLFTPVSIYLGKYSLMVTIQQMGIQIIWLAITYTAARYVLKKGLKKFESQGG